MNEKQLIEWARFNPKAFGDLYDLYYPKIFGYIFRITGDRELADDITSETFLKAWIAIGSFKWKGISISSWFFRIATNQLNQYFRRQRYTPRTMTDLGVFDMAAWETRHAVCEDEITQKIDRFEEFESCPPAVADLASGVSTGDRFALFRGMFHPGDGSDPE